MSARSYFVVAKGRGVKFWKDVWCGEMSSCDSFPSLYAIVELKDTWVKVYWSGPTDGEGWNPLFTRLFNDWEVAEVQRLLFQLGSEAVIEGREDSLSWTKSKDGLFSVKSLYKALQPRSLDHFP